MIVITDGRPTEGHEPCDTDSDTDIGRDLLDANQISTFLITVGDEFVATNSESFADVVCVSTKDSFR
jgi:hypothetical protein